VSRLKKTPQPFRWTTIPVAFTQGAAGTPVNLAAYLSNPQGRTITYSVVGTLPTGITLSGSTVSYNGSGIAATTSVRFRATSGAYEADSDLTTVSIAAPPVTNSEPVWLTPTSLGTITANTPFSFTLTASDADSDPISFIVGALPGAATATPQVQSGTSRGIVVAGTGLSAGTYTFTINADDEPPLGQVTGLVATAQSTSVIWLVWTAVSNATGYTVERSFTGTGTWTLLGSVATASYTSSGLAPGTLYFYRVRATSATQTGEYSAAASATTQAATSYYTSLAPFQVAALSTVTNGKSTWFSAVDPLYDSTSFAGGGDNAVFSIKHLSTESGGFADPDGRALYALGGGHADGAYNGILKFDLNGTTQATGWSVQTGSESSIANIPQVATGQPSENFGTYLDGKAGSTHNYGAMVFDATSRTMSRFAGSYWAVGTMAGLDLTEINWSFDFNANQWSGLPFFNGVSVGGVAVGGTVFHDKVRRKALYINSQSWGNFYNTATETFGASVTVNTTGTTITTRLQGGYDPTRNRGIIVGKGRFKMFTVDFDAETIGSVTNFTATGDTEILGATIEGLGVEYDAVLDRFWFFGGRDNSNPSVPSGDLLFNKLYWIDAADLDDGAVTVFSQALTNSSGQAFTIPVVTTGAGYFMGVYRRYCFMDDWRVIAVATSYDKPVHIIRLPS
jgi:hypothetical protein